LNLENQEENSQMRYFITGGAGFIGSHAVDRLLAKGHEVTVYDNLVTGRRNWLAAHAGNPAFQFVEGDILDRQVLQQAMAGHDIVFHLGANTDIPSGYTQTRLDLDNCIIGTWNVLDAMRELGTGDILFASSATVYGYPKVMPTPETYGPLLPESHYGAGKLACEALISGFTHLYSIKGWIYRFGNVMGGRMSHGVVYDFIQKLRRNPRELEILGDGKQTKTFLLVEDCLDGIFWAYEHDRERPVDIYNLGSPFTLSVTEIAQIVCEEMGLKKVVFRYTGGERGWPGDVPKVDFDTSKVAALGWRVTRTSAEAVRVCARRLLEDDPLTSAVLISGDTLRT
jgi:UDP-glucose 4-epimerase